MSDASLGLDLAHLIPAHIDPVFTAWTDPGLIRRWFVPPGMELAEATIDLSVGGGYRIAFQEPGKDPMTIVGAYQTIEPPRLLVFTWQWEGAEAGTTIVTVRFSESGDGTPIDLRHEMFRDEEGLASHLQGWQGCLDQLARFAQTQDNSSLTQLQCEDEAWLCTLQHCDCRNGGLGRVRQLHLGDAYRRGSLQH